MVTQSDETKSKQENENQQASTTQAGAGNTETKKPEDTEKERKDKKAADGRSQKLSRVELENQRLTGEIQELRQQIEQRELADATEKERSQPGALSEYQKNKSAREERKELNQLKEELKIKEHELEEKYAEVAAYNKMKAAIAYIEESKYTGDPQDLVDYTDGTPEGMEAFLKKFGKLKDPDENSQPPDSNTTRGGGLDTSKMSSSQKIAEGLRREKK